MFYPKTTSVSLICFYIIVLWVFVLLSGPAGQHVLCMTVHSECWSRHNKFVITGGNKRYWLSFRYRQKQKLKSLVYGIVSLLLLNLLGGCSSWDLMSKTPSKGGGSGAPMASSSSSSSTSASTSSNPDLGIKLDKIKITPFPDAKDWESTIFELKLILKQVWKDTSIDIHRYITEPKYAIVLRCPV